MENNKKSKTGLAVGITIAICLLLMAGVGYGCYRLGVSGKFQSKAENIVNNTLDIINKGIEEGQNQIEKATHKVDENYKFNVKVSKHYLFKSDEEESHLYLNDDHGFYWSTSEEIEYSCGGVYFIENNILYLVTFVEWGNGSTGSIVKGDLVKFKINGNKLLVFDKGTEAFTESSDLGNSNNGSLLALFKNFAWSIEEGEFKLNSDTILFG